MTTKRASNKSVLLIPQGTPTRLGNELLPSSRYANRLCSWLLNLLTGERILGPQRTSVSNWVRRPADGIAKVAFS
jgi:hypothetical protein